MNKKVIIILIFIILVLVAVPIFLRPSNVAGKKGSLTIKNQTFKIDVADTMMSRMQGLSGRENLGERDGMLFIFDRPSTSGFWMKDMKFPIDIIWIRGNSPSQILPGKTWEGKIIGFSENLQPEPKRTIFTLPVYRPPELIDRVLEVNAGVVKQYNFTVGDEVTISFQ